jgi:ribosome recycling factor
MIDTILSQTRTKMQKAFDITKTDLSSVRSGRATPALVENIVITAYDGTQKLKVMEMATVTTPDARSILITPYDVTTVKDLVKGIMESHAGLNPVSDGDVIRVTIPALSEEQRKEYLKLAGAKLEAGRIMIRQVRQEAMKDLKRLKDEKQIGEDEEKVGEKKVQEQTDHMIREIDDMGHRKEEELMQV